MKATFLFLSLLLCSTLGAQGSNKTDIQQPELSEELIQRRKIDQQLRNKWIKMIGKGKTEGKKYEDLTTQLLDTDHENTNRMREIVAEYGWPTHAMVGRSASNAAWILVQHADRQPDFQAECLVLLQAAYEVGEADADNYAYLHDRVKRSRGERQRYATQSVKNAVTGESSFGGLEDEARVQTNRTAMNIDRPVTEYAASMGFDYTVPTPTEAEARARAAKEAFTGFVEKARAAMATEDYVAASENYQQANFHAEYMSVTDRLELARAISLGEQRRAVRKAVYALVQAVLLGYDTPQSLLEDADYAYLKETTPFNWGDLVALVE